MLLVPFCPLRELLAHSLFYTTLQAVVFRSSLLYFRMQLIFSIYPMVNFKHSETNMIPETPHRLIYVP